MTDALNVDEVRRLAGMALTDAEAAALARAYAPLARDVARFPAGDLALVQPPLHSIPGPRV